MKVLITTTVLFLIACSSAIESENSVNVAPEGQYAMMDYYPIKVNDERQYLLLDTDTMTLHHKITGVATRDDGQNVFSLIQKYGKGEDIITYLFNQKNKVIGTNLKELQYGYYGGQKILVPEGAVRVEPISDTNTFGEFVLFGDFIDTEDASFTFKENQTIEAAAGVFDNLLKVTVTSEGVDDIHMYYSKVYGLIGSTKGAESDLSFSLSYVNVNGMIRGQLLPEK